MTTNMKNPKTLALTATVVAILGVLGTAFYHMNTKKDWMKSMTAEKEISEKLMGEKATLEKDIATMEQELAGLKTSNDQLNKSISTARQGADKYRKLASSNSGKKTISALKKELEILKATKLSLTKDLAEAKSKLKNAEDENVNLSKELAALTANNKKLSDDLAMMKSLASDEYSTTAYKGKSGDKITVNSKKAKKIVTQFTVPSYVAANCGFKIKTPDGEVIDKTAKGMSMTIIDDVQDVYASADGLAGGETMKKVQLTYTPDKKLKTGSYRVELYNGANYTASCIIQLK